MHKQLIDEDEETSPEETRMKRDQGSSKESSSLSSAAVPGSYGSTPAQHESVSRFYIPPCGLVLYTMTFLGLFCAFCLRVSLSEAIVAMVNNTKATMNINETAIIEKEQCPRDPELDLLNGEFDWSRFQQGWLLAAFYYGHELTQMPGGCLADTYGGKWFLGGCILLSSVVALLTPIAAKIHIGVVIMLRVLSGFGEGALFPSVHMLLARWSAPKYHSVVVSTIYAGMDIGTVVGIFLSGYLCDYGFAGGWPSVFYVFGTVGAVWSVLWFLLCHSSPATHPGISKTEREYWEKANGAAKLAVPMPWRKIFTSVPIWALIVTFFAEDWGFYIIVTCIPLFIHDVLGFDMLRNGAVASFPFVLSGILNPVTGLIIDWLRSPGRLSTTAVRKIFIVIGFGVTASSFALLSQVGCNRTVAVAAIFVAVIGSAVSYPNVAVNILDLAPLHAGKIMGLTYTFVNLGAIGGPMLVGKLTFKGSARAEWETVFFISAAIYAVGAVVFVIFGSGNVQSWAKVTADDDREYELGKTGDKQPVDSAERMQE